MPLKPEARTALRHVGGPSERRGDEALGALLAHAFDVGEQDEDAIRAHVHGFHSYPARLHPVTASRLIEKLGKPKGVVLDPFCGSGTVLVEARLQGATARGTDVNPLAIRLARLKTRGVPEVERKAIVDAAKWVEQHVTRRRETKARVTHRYEQEDVDLFEPHVLLELDSLRDGLDLVEPQALREDVELAFSAILTKVSRRRGDTGGGTHLEKRRLAPGYVARLFVAKAEELARALQVFEERLPRDAPPADVHADDARTLGTIGASVIDLIVTSPPYAATYDYVDHHDVRLRWLRLRADRFGKLELGARRDYARLDSRGAKLRWHDELGRALIGMARALRPDAMAVLVLADSAVSGTALLADQAVEATCGAAGLAIRAIVSQPRPHFHTPTRAAFVDTQRREHLIALSPIASPAAPPTTASP